MDTYDSPNGGPDSVTVAGGVVCAATDDCSQQKMIIVHGLGATGKLPETVGS